MPRALDILSNFLLISLTHNIKIKELYLQDKLFRSSP
jgi:hypothetical protein